MADILVDTDILIDVARGVPAASAYLDRQERGAAVAISTITQLELLIGCRNKAEQRITNQFLRRFELVRPNDQIADLAVDLILQYRLSHGLLLADAMIAATARWARVPLATKNQRDYRFIAELDLLPFPDLS